jgi:hypothetical protein
LLAGDDLPFADLFDAICDPANRLLITVDELIFRNGTKEETSLARPTTAARQLVSNRE